MPVRATDTALLGVCAAVSSGEDIRLSDRGWWLYPRLYIVAPVGPLHGSPSGNAYGRPPPPIGREPSARICPQRLSVPGARRHLGDHPPSRALSNKTFSADRGDRGGLLSPHRLRHPAAAGR